MSFVFLLYTHVHEFSYLCFAICDSSLFFTATPHFPPSWSLPLAPGTAVCSAVRGGDVLHQPTGERAGGAVYRPHRGRQGPGELLGPAQWGKYPS